MVARANCGGQPPGNVAITGGSISGITALTLGDGTAASFTVNSNLSGATDPSFAFSNASFAITTGAVIHTLNAGGYTASGSGTGVLFGSNSGMFHYGANTFQYGTSATAGAASTRVVGHKAVASIANAVATDVLTVTIPNAAHSASLKVKVTGSLGAGGAIGANEASATNTYDIIITRTAGVATVAAISSAYGAAASAVAGAATVTATATITAMSGAVGATQTFTVQVTISRSGGSSTNHTCRVVYELENANATGVTIA